MRTAGAVLGVVFLILGAAFGMVELLNVVQNEATRHSLGSIWYGLHGNSLVGFQALIEKGLSPAVWRPIQWLLLMPAWLAMIVPGVVLIALARPWARI